MTDIDLQVRPTSTIWVADFQVIELVTRTSLHARCTPNEGGNYAVEVVDGTFLPLCP